MQFRSVCFPLVVGLSGHLLAPSGSTQAAGFSAQNVITVAADRAEEADAADLDGDGDVDVLSASSFDDTIAWYENLGAGAFGARQVISASVDQAESVQAADLDGDGMLDVLAAAGGTDDELSWFRNLGGGAFGPAQSIATAFGSPQAIRAADLDGDGDQDVLAASIDAGSVLWFRNAGDGSFGAGIVITSAAAGVADVRADDLDGDGDADVLSASFLDDKVAWYENLGGGSFGPQQVISSVSTFPVALHSADLDGDGDVDVLSASRDDHLVAWYENLGGGSFGPLQAFNSGIAGPVDVHAADFDLDGDLDVVAIGQAAFDKLAWFENQGGGSFGAFQAIVPENSPAILAGSSVLTADFDGDGDADVLSSSAFDDKLAWYANQLPTARIVGVGCGSPALTFVPTAAAVLANTMSARVENALDATLVSLGFSDTLSSLGSLPLDLGPLGFTGCTLYGSIELFGLPTQATSDPTQADWSLLVPGSASLAGTHAHTQAFSFLLSPPFSVHVSNGIDWQIGS